MKLVKMRQDTAEPERVSLVEQGGSSKTSRLLNLARMLSSWRSRIWPLLLVVLLVILLIPYLRVIVATSPHGLSPSTGVPLALFPIVGASVITLFSLLRPAWALAAFFAVAPVMNGLVAWVTNGDPVRYQKAGLFAVELLFLSLAIGLLLRCVIWPDPVSSKRVEKGIALYVIAVLASMILFYLQDPWWWDRLMLAWRHLPVGRQLSPNHPLRAGLLILASLLCYRLTLNRLITLKEVQLVCRGWLVAGILTGLYGLLWARPEDPYYPRVDSVLDDVNSYGSYLVLTLFIAWGEYLAEKKWWARVMAALTLLLTVWMIPLSSSRFAVIAAVAGAGIAWMTLARSGRARWIRGCILVALASGILVFLLLGGRKVIEETPQNHPGPPSPSSWRVNRLAQAMDARLMLKNWREFHQALWAAGLRMVVDEPTFGQGPGTFYTKLGDYYRPGDEGWKPLHENAHNYFIQIAAETGILGLAGFLWCVSNVMVSGFTRALIGERLRTRLLTIGVGSYLLTALAQHPLVLSRQAFLFWGYLGILAACLRLNQAPPAPPHLSSQCYTASEQ